MENLVKRLSAIKDEIARLKSENDALKAMQLGKEKDLMRLKNLVEIQNSSIRQLEQKLKIKRIADEVAGDASEESGNNRDLKFKINEMIKEVDKVISLMHQ